ncbi:MAG: class I SAM-dependent methyltransferase [Planctomycetaceae bacterium]
MLTEQSAKPAPTQSPASANCPACPGCGSPVDAQTPRFQLESVRGPSPFARCRHCQAYFMQGDYEAAAEEQHTRQMAWGELDRGTQLNSFKQKMYHAILDGIERHGLAEASLLDVGCSFGGFLLAAQQRGFRCSGVDIVSEAVEYVQQCGLPAQKCASLEECRLHSPENPVDVLTVLDAHIYWPDQPRELRAAWKLLRPGGLLVIRALTKAPFISAGRALQKVAPGFSKKLIRRAITDHRFSMPLNSLLTTIQNSGFEILEASPKGAQHSDDSAFGVRAAFALGTFTWHSLGVALAPGALIFARKPSET